MRDIKKQTGLLHYIEQNTEIMSAYPEALNIVLDDWFRVDGTTRSEKIRRIPSIVRSKRKLTRILNDALVLGRKFL